MLCSFQGCKFQCLTDKNTCFSHRNQKVQKEPHEVQKEVQEIHKEVHKEIHKVHKEVHKEVHKVHKEVQKVQKELKDLPTELHLRIFDQLNMEELLLLYKNPPNKLYRELLKDYYTFENLKDFKTHRSLLSLIYRKDLIDIPNPNPNIDIDIVLEILKKKNMIKNNSISVKKDNIKVIYFLQENKIISKVFLINGQIHRIDGPSIIEFYENGHIKSTSWYINGRLNRMEDLPSIIGYDNNGQRQIISKNWFKDGVRHRDNGPAFINYNNGQIIKKWYKDGQLHRDDGPAIINYDINGQIISQAWYINGILVQP